MQKQAGQGVLGIGKVQTPPTPTCRVIADKDVGTFSRVLGVFYLHFLRLWAAASVDKPEAYTPEERNIETQVGTEHSLPC